MSAEQSATADGAALDSEQLANRIAEIASDRKAIDIRVVDVRGLVSSTDYLDCVAHIFTPDARDFYRLDKLWGDAPQRTVD